MSLTTTCSAIIEKNLPHKMQDPRSFIIPCTIGSYEFGEALCDSGASINLMPLSVVKRRGLKKLSPTTMFLQMVDRSIAKPKGILEDVLVKVGKFIFLVDFVVINIKEDKQIPLLLSKPFLATEVAFIEVKKRELTLIVDIEELHFSLNKSLQQHNVKQSRCMKIDSSNLICNELNYDLMKKNSFNNYISSSFYIDDFEKKELIAKTVLSLNKKNTKSLKREKKKF